MPQWTLDTDVAEAGHAVFMPVTWPEEWAIADARRFVFLLVMGGAEGDEHSSTRSVEQACGDSFRVWNSSGEEGKTMRRWHVGLKPEVAESEWAAEYRNVQERLVEKLGFVEYAVEWLGDGSGPEGCELLWDYRSLRRGAGAQRAL